MAMQLEDGLPSSRPVDDGRGVISCVQWRNHEDSDEGLYVPALGELVSVQGRISEYRGQRQIKITHICILASPVPRTDM